MSMEDASPGRSVTRGGSGGGRKSAYGRLKTLIACALLAYAVIAVAGSNLSKHREWFPVFSWSLFSEIPAYGWATRLEIVAINGVPLKAPVFYRDLTEVFPKARNTSIAFNKLLNRIAVDHHDGAPNAGRLNALKERYLADVDSVAWRIVRLVTDPIDYYRTGAVATRYVWLEGRFPADPAE